MFRCKRGQKKAFRYRTTATSKQRLGGCMKRGRFVKIKEVKTFKNNSGKTNLGWIHKELEKKRILKKLDDMRRVRLEKR